MILDTFVSVFEADTGKLKQGFNDARKSTDEMVDSMKKAEGQANVTGSSVISMAQKVAGFIATAVLANKTIGGVMERASEIHAMNQTAESIGVAVGELDAFQRALADNGGTAQGAQAALTGLFKAAGEAANKAGSEQGKVFSSMGINIRDTNGNIKDSVTLMQDLAGAVEGMDAAKAEAYISKLGITDRRTIETIMKGKIALQDSMRAHKDLGVVTKESAEMAARFDDAQNKMRGGIERSKDALVNLLLPAITWTLEKFSDLVKWANENKNYVAGFFIGIAAAVTAFYLPAMLSAAAATIAATWPILLAVAGIAALAAVFALLYDDVMNFMEANDSMIGQISEKYPAIGEAIKGLIDIFNQLWDGAKWVFEQMAILAKWWSGVMLNAFTEFVNSLLWAIDEALKFGKEMGGIFDSMANGIVDVFKWMVDKVREYLGFVTGAADGIKSAFDWVKDKLSSGNVTVTAANNSLNQAGREPMNGVTPGMIASNNSSRSESYVQVGEVKVQTQATDAKGIAKDIGGELRGQLKNLQQESATGIAR